MFVSIVSDIHDNINNLKKYLAWCQNNKIKKIIFCGDAANIKTINYLATNFSGEIFVVRGNAETYIDSDLKKIKNINYCGEIAVKKITNLKIGFCHQPYKIKQILKNNSDLDFIFYGHTHRPDLKKSGSTIIANPGNLKDPSYSASFAVLNTNTKKLELKILASLESMNIS